MNNSLFFFFYNLAHQSVFFDGVIVFFAVYFPFVVLLLAKIFLLLHHEVITSQNPFKEYFKKWKEIFFVFISSGVAWCVAKILKNLIQTERPFVVFDNVKNLVVDNSYAFPSGHATFFMALAVSLFFYHKKVGFLFMFFALIIGIARIMAGVHFPLDILGGLALGSLIAYLFSFIQSKPE